MILLWKIHLSPMKVDDGGGGCGGFGDLAANETSFGDEGIWRYLSDNKKDDVLILLKRRQVLKIW